jgi:hypothetical protein
MSRLPHFLDNLLTDGGNLVCINKNITHTLHFPIVVILENIQRYNKICCVFLQCVAVSRDFGCYSNTHSHSSFMQPCKMSIKFA